MSKENLGAEAGAPDLGASVLAYAAPSPSPAWSLCGRTQASSRQLPSAGICGAGPGMPLP